MRSFSIASAPHEESVMVGTRMRDTAFKRVLRTVPLGTAVKIERPSGDFILKKDAAQTAIFLAGGIGLTPFRSIVHWAAKEKLPNRIVLFLFQQAAGRCALPRRAAEPGTGQSEVQAYCQHD